ncbi:MAG TPA: FtsQ-type POTRA domain-containing protein [Pyrinomonadaceae bacterium]|jgi:cell division protein FtsQ|nr:FtsQ-type POTRA domain-containing protein [Pyrinomonadaceae bacterium]
MLREQVITPRAGRGTQGGGGRARAGDIAQQRPVKRGGNGGSGRSSSGGGAASRKASKGSASSWSSALAWMPFVGKTLLVVCVAVLCFTAYRTASSSSFFQLRTVDVSGISQGSEDQIKSLVRRAGAASGVWKADLDSISAELERQPWVRKAIVTRVLPSGLRVRITERTPRAVVRTAAGRFIWVDDDGVMTGTVAPTQNAPAFFMRGWDESGTESGRTENRRRVEKYLELSREWEAAGIAARVSEVNLDDLRDVRAQLTGDDSQIEVRLGREDLTKRLTQSLEALDEQRSTPRGAHITYIDMTQGKRAVIGFKAHALNQSGAAAPEKSDESAANGNLPAAPDATTTANVAADANRRPAEAKKPAVVQASNKSRPAAEKASKDKADKKQTHARDGVGSGERTATGQTRSNGSERPRRVGRSG